MFPAQPPPLLWPCPRRSLAGQSRLGAAQSASAYRASPETSALRQRDLTLLASRCMPALRELAVLPAEWVAALAAECPQSGPDLSGEVPQSPQECLAELGGTERQSEKACRLPTGSPASV